MARRYLTPEQVVSKFREMAIANSSVMGGQPNYELVYTVEKNNVPRIYVLYNGQQYIVTSSDLDLPMILAVLPSFDTEDESFVATEGILDNYACQVEWYQRIGYEMPASYRAPAHAGSSTKENITPLLKGISDCWAQRVYKNNTSGKYGYPITYHDISSNEDITPPCGCNALSLSQVFAYWASKGYNIGCKQVFKYTSQALGNYVVEVPELPALHTFDWEKIRNTNSYQVSGNSPELADARNTLYKYVQRSIASSFTPSASYSTTVADLTAATYYFGFSKQAKVIDVQTQEDVDTIYNSLAEGKPVIYAANTMSADGKKIADGHCVVIDGYKSSHTIGGITEYGDFFHINTGSGFASSANASSNTSNWYRLINFVGTSDRYTFYVQPSAIVDLIPSESIYSDSHTGIQGDVTDDGLINMIDATAVINTIIAIDKPLQSKFAVKDDIGGLQITGPTGNSLFLPYAGAKVVTKGVTEIRNKGMVAKYLMDSLEKMLYLSGSGDLSSGDMLNIEKYNFVGFFTSNYGNVRLVYKGNTPDEDGAVDLGLYLPGEKKEDPPVPILWAPMNVGATSPGDPGTFYTKGLSVASMSGVDTSKWRLPTVDEMQCLIDNVVPIDNLIEKLPSYHGVSQDVNEDGRIDMKDVDWILDAVLGKHIWYYHSYNKLVYKVSKDTITNTDQFKEIVSSECYYGGYYRYSGNLSVDVTTLEPYNSSNAAVASATTVGNKIYYVNEVPKSRTKNVIIGSDFTAIPWNGPLSRAYIGDIPEDQANIVSSNLGETVDSFTISNNSTTANISDDEGNYILFPTAATQSTIINNGITIETLDGVQVKLTFIEGDFDTQYQQWSLVQ